MKGNLNLPDFCGRCTTIASNLFFTTEITHVSKRVLLMYVKLQLKKISQQKGEQLKFCFMKKTCPFFRNGTHAHISAR